MRPRTALIAVLALAVAAPVPASAATKKKRTPPPPPACMLVTDAPGDGKSGSGFVSSDALDIISGDIATGKTEIVAVLRLKSNAFKDTWHYGGYTWRLAGTAAGQRWVFRAGNDAWGNVNSAMEVGTTGIPQAKFELGPNNTLIWRAKRSDVAALAKPNLVWTDFAANTAWLSTPADYTDLSKKVYKDKQSSCVVAK
ncbi:MAG TPA: hypothetical protein VNA20_02390 [Frankiaceae bacterium]|nr:hypothetical protein [Frankiaceae bacterium]